MSYIDKRALREAAEKATKGQWAVEFDDEIYSTDGVNHEQIAMVFSENEASDAAFIAAANPDTVLALLDELEAAEKRIADAGNSTVIPDGWVVCSERMPVDNDIVLVVDDGYFVCEAQFRDGDFYSAARGNGEFFETTCRDVELWMPLPEAPQQEVK
jgi:hypothetical protein